MKKLIVCSMCCFLALAVHAQQIKNGNQRMNAQVDRQVQKMQKNAPVKIAGDKRLVTVRLEVQEPINERKFLHRYWSCPAVIFNKAGALAFDGECWQAIEEAAQLSVGPAVQFFVDLGKLGEYTQSSEVGKPFYFRSSYVALGPAGEDSYSVDEAFKQAADKSYIIYKLSLFNDPTNEDNPENSEVKQAIAQYYRQNNLKEVNVETLSKYFKQKSSFSNKFITSR